MSKHYEHTYNSLGEVLEVIDKEWTAKDDFPPDTEENRELVADGLFWSGVEMIRFNYSKSDLYKFMAVLNGIKKRWEDAEKDGTGHEND